MNKQKLNHLILTVPNSSVEIIIDFENEHFIFACNKNTDEIKRNGEVQDYKNGRLKIIDCKNFMTALKSSWIFSVLFAQTECTELFETQFRHSL